MESCAPTVRHFTEFSDKVQVCWCRRSHIFQRARIDAATMVSFFIDLNSQHFEKFFEFLVKNFKAREC